MRSWTWDMLDSMNQLQREIDRVFSTFTPRMGGWERPFLRPPLRPERQWLTSYPLINMGEDADHYFVEVLAPGFGPEELKVSLKNGQLSLTGERKGLEEQAAPEMIHRNERASGRFSRTVGLPGAVEEGKITAQYHNGLLRLTLPKAEAAKPKQITVTVG